MLLTLARVTAAALLVASAAAFATGATIERHAASTESPPAQHHAETGTPGENSGGENPAGSGENSATHAAGQSSEDLLGINPEATGLVVIAAVVSLLLAALVLTVRSSLLAAGVALAMLAFTVLDIRELTHQLHESRPGLAALAATVAALHLLAAAAALLTTRGTRGTRGISTA